MQGHRWWVLRGLFGDENPAEVATEASVTDSKDVPELLRKAAPRWASIFDLADTDQDGTISLDEVVKAFSQIMGGILDVPMQELERAFHCYDLDEDNKVDFWEFCAVVRSVRKFMSDFPNWEREESWQIHKGKERKRLAMTMTRSSQMFQSQHLQERRLSFRQPRERRKSLATAGGDIVKSQSQGNLRRGLNRYCSQASCCMTTPHIWSAGMEMNHVVEDSIFPSLARTASKSSRGFWPDRSRSSTGTRGTSRVRQVMQAEVFDFDVPPFSTEPAEVVGERGCLALRFSHDCNQLAAGFCDGHLRTYDASKAVQVHDICLSQNLNVGRTESSERRLSLSVGKQSNETVTNLRWQPGGSRPPILATVSTKGRLSLWEIPAEEDASTKKLTSVRCGESLRALAFSADGGRIFVGGKGGVVQAYDIHQHGLGSLSCHAACSLGGGPSPPNKVFGHSSRVVSMCPHPVWSQVVVSCGIDRQVLVWDLRVGQEPVGVMFGPLLCGDAMDISTDGSTLLTGSHNPQKQVQLYDLRMPAPGKPWENRGRMMAEYDWKGDVPLDENSSHSCLLFSVGWDAWTNKVLVAAGEFDNSARAFEMPESPHDPLKVVGTLHNKGSAFWSAAISADGKNVAFGCADGSLCLTQLRRKGAKAAVSEKRRSAIALAQL